MGRFSVIDGGELTWCHVCNFDLREAPPRQPAIYDDSAFHAWRSVLQLLEGDLAADARYDVGYFAVAHQLCKIMLTHYSHVHLRQYVSENIHAPGIQLRQRREPFEQYSLDERHVVIQLVMWLLADPAERIVAAWRDKAVRYNILGKDFIQCPQWYREIVSRCSDWRKMAG